MFCSVLFLWVTRRLFGNMWVWNLFFMETVIILGFWGVGMAYDDRLRLFGSEYSREEKE